MSSSLILEQISHIAYRLELLEMLAGLHDVFHVSQLRKNIYSPNVELQAGEVHLQPNMIFEIQPV